MSVAPAATSPAAQTISVKPVVLPAPERGDDLQVRVSAPVTGTDLPVIVFAHGFGGSMTFYDPLVDHWTANGFVVVQPTFLDSASLAVTPDDPRYPDIWRIRVDDLEYLHVHPEEGAVPEFMVSGLAPGQYRFFFDFQIDGVVRTAAFTVEEHGHDSH